MGYKIALVCLLLLLAPWLLITFFPIIVIGLILFVLCMLAIEAEKKDENND